MEHRTYLTSLKGALKAKGVSYKDLARRLRMTESGVKKMMNAKDISFSRVVQICNVLSVTPGQLFAQTEALPIADAVLTAKQEDALMRHRDLLAVYWRFAVEGEAPREIQRQERLSEPGLKKLMDRLAALGLIRARGAKYEPLAAGKFRWPPDSALARHLNREWSELTLRRALKGGDGSLHRLVGMKLGPEDFALLQRRLNDVLDQAVLDSGRAELTRKTGDLMRFSALVAVVPRGVLDSDV